MNIFLYKISTGEINNLTQLKSFFRKQIKELHPDITGKDSKEFILTYQYYQDARKYFDAIRIQTKSSNVVKKYKQSDMFDLFVDLMASNFPLDKRVEKMNKIYQQRIHQMNAIVNSLIKEDNLFTLFTNDLYVLRGNTVIMNHEYNVVISYLNNIRDYIIFKTVRGKKYIENTYDLIFGIAVSKKLSSFLLFMNWLVINIIGEEKIKGNLPNFV